MKKILTLSFLLLNIRIAHAQEQSSVEVPPFWQDKTFLFLVGGAIFLILILIIKKILEKRAMASYQENDTSAQNYEN